MKVLTKMDLSLWSVVYPGTMYRVSALEKHRLSTTDTDSSEHVAFGSIMPLAFTGCPRHVELRDTGYANTSKTWSCICCFFRFRVRVLSESYDPVEGLPYCRRSESGLIL